MFERTRSVGVLAAGAVLAGLLSDCSLQAADRPSPQDFAHIERGRYLTAVADCAACHTDSSDKPFAGGKGIETPFGMVLAANITSDRETGIGNWSSADFEAAVREGRLPNGQRLYPAMPYPYYTRLSDADLVDIRAYLRTLAPIHNEVHSNQLPFPFRIRAALRIWDWLYFKPGRFEPDPSRSPSWNRGAYLVRGPGHCGACHTPKTKLGGDEQDKQLQGYSLQGWFAPNITNDASRGIGAWSSAEIVKYLKTGHNRFGGAAGPMAEEVAHASSLMTQDDLTAIAEYLKDQPGQTSQAKALAGSDPRMGAGRAIYDDLCSACHARDGQGVAQLIPNLAASAAVASRESTSVLRVVLQGAQTVATQEEPTAPAMPGFGWQLSDAQVAAVATYIRNSWGHDAPATTPSEVHAARQRLRASAD